MDCQEHTVEVKALGKQHFDLIVVHLTIISIALKRKEEKATPKKCADILLRLNHARKDLITEEEEVGLVEAAVEDEQELVFDYDVEDKIIVTSITL